MSVPKKPNETEHHLITEDCPTYPDIKNIYQNLESDKELISFFWEVLERRDELDKQTQDMLLMFRIGALALMFASIICFIISVHLLHSSLESPD